MLTTFVVVVEVVVVTRPIVLVGVVDGRSNENFSNYCGEPGEKSDQKKAKNKKRISGRQTTK